MKLCIGNLKFGEMEFGEMKRNTSNFCILLSRAGLSASAGLSCNSGSKDHKTRDKSNDIKAQKDRQKIHMENKTVQ